MQEIRAFLTEMLVRGGLSDELINSVKTMRKLTLEGLSALERWQDYCGTLERQPHEWGREEYALQAEWDDAKEDYVSSITLFKQRMHKTMREVAQAHSLDFIPD